VRMIFGVQRGGSAGGRIERRRSELDGGSPRSRLASDVRYL
jgi:hypothetical protein